MSREVAAEPGMSYEAVLEAVQESSRGRWFLNEFKLRNAGVDSRQILGAIARLETRMESLSPAGGDANAELARVRKAIATTRQDILKASGTPGLSEEGKLFAHLAELARKTLAQNQSIGGTTPGSEALPGSIVQVLRLVDQLDGSLNSNKRPETPYADNFFGRDMDLFQSGATQIAQARQPAQPAPAKPALVPPAAPAPAAVTVPAPAKPITEAPPLGARLVINRSKSTETTKAPPAPPPAMEEPKPAEPKSDAGTTGHPRVIISRRKPEDMPAPESDTTLPTENAA